jgi:hypothetical protein
LSVCCAGDAEQVIRADALRVLLNSNIKRRRPMSLASTLLPIARHAPLVCDCKDCGNVVVKRVVNCVGKVAKDNVANAVLVNGPQVSALCERVNRFNDFNSEAIRSEWASIKVPKERLSDSASAMGSTSTVKGFTVRLCVLLLQPMAWRPGFHREVPACAAEVRRAKPR